MIWGAAATSVAESPRPSASIVATATHSFAFMAVPPCAGLSRRGAVKASYRDAYLLCRAWYDLIGGPTRAGSCVCQVVDHTDEPGLLEALLHAIDHVARRAVGGPGRLPLALLVVEAAEDEVSPPQLGRVADLLGDRERPAKSLVSVVPLPPLRRDLARQPPAPRQIPTRVRACPAFQAFLGEPARPVVVAAGERELTQAGEEVDRVPPLLPLARRRIAHEPVHALERVVREREVPLGQARVGEVDLGVGLDLVVPALAPALRPLPVTLQSPVEVTQIRVEPSERVQSPIENDFLADLLGQGLAFSQHGEGVIVIPLADQDHGLSPETQDEGHQKPVLPRKAQGRRRQGERAGVIALPVLQLPRHPERKGLASHVARRTAHGEDLVELSPALFEPAGDDVD